VQFELIDGGRLKVLAKELKQQAEGKQLRKDLVKELRTEGNRVRDRVRAAWLSAPSEGHGTASAAREALPDLRKLLAKATRTQVRLTGKEAGVRVRTDGRKMPNRMRGLPRIVEGLGHAVDGRPGRWRHPVFGNPDVWVSQRPFPRFYAAVRASDDMQERQACERAVEAMFQRIARTP